MIRAIPQLFAGLFLCGFSMAMLVRANLGLDPWDVFHQGLSERMGVSFGIASMITGAGVLLLWIPLRQRPGWGTISNIISIGLAVDFGLWVIPEIGSLALRYPLLIAGILLNGLGGSIYIGASLGPGPRDGLMTGIVARSGWSVRLVRTVIEVTILAIGWLLGGSVGIGTILFAILIGPTIHTTLPFFIIGQSKEPIAPDSCSGR